MDRIKKLFHDERILKIIRYVFFGGCTTLINFVLFALLKDVLGIEINIANTIAVISSILFAYVTNKLFVFRSQTEGNGALIREMISFFSARGITLLLDIGSIFLIHTVMHVDEAYSFYTKAIVNVAVLILNFVFSQKFVFNKK